MGWQISKKEIKGQTKYKLWSTISDSYITPNWLTKEGLFKVFFWNYMQDFMQRFLETTMQFPDGWSDRESDTRLKDEVAKKSYWDLISKSLKDNDCIGDTFLAKLKELGIEMKIKEGKYFIDTEE